MSQDFEFTEQQPPNEPFKPVDPVPPVAARPIPVAMPVPVAVAKDPLYRSPISVGTGLLVSLAMLGGLGYVGYDDYKNPAPPAEAPKADPAADPSTTPPPPAAEAKPPASDAVGAEVAELKGSLKAITARLDEMAAKPAPDLKPLEEKVGEATKSSEAIAGLTAKLTALDEKVTGMSKPEAADSAKVEAVEKRVAEIAAALEAFKGEVAEMSKASAMKPEPAKPATEAKPPVDVNTADQAMSQASDLFKQKKYAESLEKFTKLQADYPEDARVWYFSALANGLASRNWRGETERLVNLGVEKEKAGSPETSKIDALFADLTAANGKEWLAAYRARASSR